MADEVERYGAGLPRVGQRAMSDQERRLIDRKLGHLRFHLAVVGIISLTLVGATLAIVDHVEPTLLARVGGPWGLIACSLGAAGSLACLLGGRRWWRLAAVGGATYLLSVAAIAALSEEARLPSETATWTVFVGMVLLGNAYGALHVLRRVRVLGRGNEIRGDLELGVVEQYAGRSRTRFVDEALRRLAADGLITDREGLEPLRLDLLPTSGLVLRVDGQFMPRLELAHVVEVAPAQPHAFRVALPDGVAPAQEMPRVSLKRRSLSPAEREELAKHIAQLRRPHWPAVAVTVALVALVASWTADGMRWPELFDVTALAWYALAIITYTAYARRVWAARKLEYDRRLRWVVTVDDPKRSAEHPCAPKLEVLPISQLAWTENASPAGWRITRL